MSPCPHVPMSPCSHVPMSPCPHPPFQARRPILPMTTEAAGHRLLVPGRDTGTLDHRALTHAAPRPGVPAATSFAWLPGLALATCLLVGADGGRGRILAGSGGNAPDRRSGRRRRHARVDVAARDPADLGGGAAAVRLYDVRRQRHLERLVAKRTEQLTAEIAERRRAAVELEAAREAALNASKLKSEFLANVSHEIRTPMNGVMGMTDLALQMPLPAEARRYLEVAQSSADLLLQVIDDVLDFSKVEAGRLDYASGGARYPRRDRSAGRLDGPTRRSARSPLNARVASLGAAVVRRRPGAAASDSAQPRRQCADIHGTRIGDDRGARARQPRNRG